MKKIPVVIIDSDSTTVEKIITLLKSIINFESVKVSSNIKDLETILFARNPMIVLIGPSYELNNFEEILITQNSALDIVKVIMLVNETSTETLKRAIKLNMHDVLEFPFTDNDFKESINRINYIFEEVQDIEAKEIKSKTEHKNRSKKIMFFSTKGGSGSTFLAINLAIDMRSRTRKEVILFDLNYQFGDVALMLNLYPKNTVYDLISMINQADNDIINIFLTTHNTGVKVLPAPIDPSQGEAINNGVSVKIIDFLSKVGDYIIIDAPFGFTDLVLSFLEKVDHLCMIATKDVPSIKNLKVCLQVLEKLKYPKEKIVVILNRADSKVDFDLSEIEKTIQTKVDVKIPSDRAVSLSINRGIPLILNSPKSPISKSINQLTGLLLSGGEILKLGK